MIGYPHRVSLRVRCRFPVKVCYQRFQLKEVLTITKGAVLGLGDMGCKYFQSLYATSLLFDADVYLRRK